MTIAEAETREETEDEKVMQIVKEILGDKYYNLKAVNGRAQTTIFTANFGSEEGPKRSIKVDKTNITGPRAKRYSQRGCNTLNHIHTLSRLPEADEHNIVGVLDYFDVTEEHGIAISVHKYVEGRTLEEVVKERVLGADEIRSVFSDVFDAVRYYSQKGYLHRDPNPSNILIEGRIGKQRAKLIDFCNSGNQEALVPKPQPTGGNRAIMSPTLNSDFTGIERKYEGYDEAFAYSDDLHFAATGKHVFDLDPDNKTLKDARTGESLLKEDGKLDYEKCEDVIQRAVREMPKPVRKRFGSLIERGLSQNPEKRFGSLDEFLDSFYEAAKPTFWDKVKKNKVAIGIGSAAAAGVVALGLIGPVSAFMMHNTQKNLDLEAKVREAEKYPVTSEWNGSKLEVESNLFDLEVQVFRSKPFDIVYHENVKGAIHFNQGDNISVSPYLYSKPVPGNEHYSFPAFSGRVYIEGFEGKEFSSYLVSKDHAKMRDGWEYTSVPYIEMQIPKDLPDGCYNLVSEVYAPSQPDPANVVSALKSTKFVNPGKVLSRKRIPLIVGQVKDKVAINSLGLSYSNFINFQDVDNSLADINPNLDYIIRMPELNFEERMDKEKYASRSSFSGSIWLPKLSDDKERLLVAEVINKEGKVISSNYIPVCGDKVGDSYWYKFSLPGRDFHDKIIEYNKSRTSK